MVHSVKDKKEKISPLRLVFFLLRLGSFRLNLLSLFTIVPLLIVQGLLEGSSYFAFLSGLAQLGGEDLSAEFKFLHYFNLSFTGWLTFGVALQLIKFLCSAASAALASRLFRRVECCLQSKVSRQIVDMPYQETLQYRSGELVEIERYAIGHTSQLLTQAFIFSQHLLLAFSMALGMFFISWQLSLTMAVGGACIVCTQRFLKKKILAHTASAMTEINDVISKLIEIIANIKVLHLFYLRNFFLKNSDESMRKVSEKHSHAFFIEQITPAFMEFVAILFIGICFVIGAALLGAKHTHFLPILITFGGISYRFVGKLNAFLASALSITVQSLYIQRVKEFLQPLEQSEEGSSELSSFDKQIDCSNLTFSYPSTNRPAISDLSISIPKATTLAIVGRSGSGKTTLIDLLLGLYKPSSGSIKIDGSSLQLLDTASWRKKIGVVTQDSIMFNDTLRNNILIGNSQATRDEFETAVQVAHVSDFAKRLPNGFETDIGERGYKLSGGEKQRIALARAIIRKPDVLILDEATSHLDSISEQAIQDSLKKLAGKMTIILIAHRLSTVIGADKIVVMEHGRLIEQGTHTELLATNRHYYQLWNSQFTEQSELVSSI